MQIIRKNNLRRLPVETKSRSKGVLLEELLLQQQIRDVVVHQVPDFRHSKYKLSTPPAQIQLLFPPERHSNRVMPVSLNSDETLTPSQIRRKKRMLNLVANQNRSFIGWS